MFTFQDVLKRAGIAAEDVNVMLPSPRDGDLITMLPGLLRTRRRATKVFQAFHTLSTERFAGNIDALISAIPAKSTFDADLPPWRGMVIGAGLLRALPPSWAARLREWRGIYHILDVCDGARYVGAAYGDANLLGRWQAHEAGDHGVTVELARRDALNFRFSILERLSLDLDGREVTQREQTWMTRLHTRQYGLNA